MLNQTVEIYYGKLRFDNVYSFRYMNKIDDKKEEKEGLKIIKTLKVWFCIL